MLTWFFSWSNGVSLFWSQFLHSDADVGNYTHRYYFTR
jgi:hypothetical protein